jgi:DNA-binding beta-propeller fold protein YncE
MIRSGALSLAAVAALAMAPAAFQTAAPSYEVDPLWPKPLPNHWLLGSVTGVAVDARDHVWVVHRGYDSMTARTEIGAATNPKTSDECCVPAPPVLEFDAAGTLVGHFGAAQGKSSNNYTWPLSPGGITVDAQGNVWIAAAGPPDIPGSANARPASTGAARGGATPTPTAAIATTTTTTPGRGAGAATPPRPVDAHVLKFSRTGEFLLQIGKAGEPGGDDSTTGLHRPAGTAVDTAANEVYVADGYVNHRVVVFDATTGAFKRKWGGTGDARFTTVGCAEIAKDGTVYVCDRGNNRVQAFDKNGRLLKQGIVAQETKGTGSVWDIALSSDPQQRFLFVADGHDQKVFILRRDTLEVIGSFGDGGRYPGTFYSVGSIAVDSRGNVYTGETLEGKRVQKFVPKGASR